MVVRSIGSNQIEVHKKNGEFLVSYSTPVAAYIKGIGYVRTSQFFSRTTSKHINKWLGEVKAKEMPQETLQKHFGM